MLWMELESKWLSYVVFLCQSSWIIWDCLVPYARSKCSNDYFVVSDFTSANMILIPNGSISHSSIIHSSRSFRYESWVFLQCLDEFYQPSLSSVWFNPLNPELNPICYLLALLAYHFLHVSRIRVKSLTIKLLMSYIYIWSTYSWCF